MRNNIFKLFSSFLSWTAKKRGGAEKKKQQPIRIPHHFFAEHNLAAIKKNGKVSYTCLGANKQGETRKYKDNLENPHDSPKYSHVLHEKEIASLF